MADTTVAKDPGQQDGVIYAFPVAAVKLVAGAAVNINTSGFIKNAADAASEIFAGVMDKTVDNAAGAAGAKKGRVIRQGVFDFAFSGTANQAAVGQKCYAVDNQTVALAATTTNDVLVGRIVEFVSASKVRVQITPAV